MGFSTYKENKIIKREPRLRIRNFLAGKRKTTFDFTSKKKNRFEVCVRDSRSRFIQRQHEVLHPDYLKRKVKFPAFANFTLSKEL